MLIVHRLSKIISFDHIFLALDYELLTSRCEMPALVNYFLIFWQTERSCARMGRRASHNLVLEKTRLVYKL